MASNSDTLPYYYDRISATEISYWDYLLKIVMARDIENSTENNIDELIEYNEVFTKRIRSAIIYSQIASERAIYNNMQILSGTLTKGFSGISRQIGIMTADMNMGFASINNTIHESAKAILEKLDMINDIFNNPFLTKSRELYRRASLNYNKGFYEEVKEDLLKAVANSKTDYISWFLLGKTYLFGLSEFSDTVDLYASCEALKTSAKYIKPDAKAHDEARVTAAEIWFYIGLAQMSIANDLFHESKEAKENKESEYKNYLVQAKEAFTQSWNYSQGMLESMYNLGRCNVLLGDINTALQVLETVILKDIRYCIKIALDSDFESIREELYEFLNDIKKTMYPEIKGYFENIKKIMAVFQEPYSSELTQLIEGHLPDTFEDNMPLFDILEGKIFFPDILTLLKKEIHQKEEFAIHEKERERQEALRKQEEMRRQSEILASIGVFDNTLKKYTGAGGSVVLPNGITDIGDRAFSGCYNITSITLPSSVVSIGERAFSRCYHLTNITLPSSIKSIGDRAFSGCHSLPSIALPASVKSIGEGAFSWCSNLTNITIPSSVSSIGDCAFYRCSNLVNITLPASITSIGKWAFSECYKLTSITLPASFRNKEHWELGLYSVTIVYI